MFSNTMKEIKAFIKNFLIRSLGSYSHGWVVKRIKILDLNLLLNLDSYIDYLISIQGYYDKTTLDKINELLIEGEEQNLGDNLFFDIGSNIGLMSLYVRKVLPTVQVYAFEPISQNFYQNHMNQAINDLSYPLYKVLLGSRKEDSVKVYLGKEHPDQDYGKMNMGTPSIYLRSNNDSDKYEICNMTTFDDFWKNLIHTDEQKNIRKCVIKIDVEGAELDVISGMKNFLEDNEKIEVIFIIELLFESLYKTCCDVVEFMGRRGYKLYEYSGQRIYSCAESHSGNYLFKRG